ncbi:MAG: hypothetical protein H6735_01725 [Alphaproteobacteria bacterium]|nr:hypothetical protein [Alphaproteobacteria bacterium]
MNPGFDLVGLWNHPRLLLRLLAVIDSPWEALETGFTHRETGERVSLTMSPPNLGLVEAMLAGTDPVLPTIDEAIAKEMVDHRSVVGVSIRPGPDVLQTALTLLRGTDAIVNGGALALRCRTSGLSHGADGYQLLVAEAERAEGREELARALIRAMVLLVPTSERPCTIGLHALGAPDIVLKAATDPDRALARLEAAALAAVLDPPTEVEADARGLPEPLRNTVGVVTR